MVLKLIEFVFENCDSLKVEGKDIGDIRITGLSEEIKRIAIDNVNKIDTCEEFYVEIYKEANKVHYELGIDNIQTTVFERLSRQDLTNIGIILIDNEGKEEERYRYYVKWEGDSMDKNKASRSYIGSNGALYLRIKDRCSNVVERDKIRR